MEPPRKSAARIMKLPREKWMEARAETVEPHLQELVRKHISNALWRKKWAERTGGRRGRTTTKNR